MDRRAKRDEGVCVLVVDDHEDSVDVFRAILNHHGFHVVVAANGAEAVRLARECHPAVVLMDLWMPVMDGWTATAALKQDPATANAAVIAVSANAQDDTRRRAIEAGCIGFLAKPVEPIHVVEEVQRVLDLISAEGSPPV